MELPNLLNQNARTGSAPAGRFFVDHRKQGSGLIERDSKNHVLAPYEKLTTSPHEFRSG